MKKLLELSAQILGSIANAFKWVMQFIVSRLEKQREENELAAKILGNC